MKEWKLEELAVRADVSPRTVRYYVQRGLLPSPVFRGRDTMYGEEHLLRLRAIRKLQERFLPLDAIEAELTRLSPAALAEVAKGARGAAGLRSEAASRASKETEPAAVETPAATTRWTRTVLAPGLELHLAHDAAPALHALAESLVAESAHRLREPATARHPHSKKSP